jgi:UDP-glucose 4-epimerase
MNILIIGGCGYIGSHLSTFFKKDDTVVLLDNFSNSKNKVIKNIKSISKSKIIIINGNANDVVLLEKIIKKYNIKNVVHLAALKSISDSIKYPEMYFENNFVSTVNVVSAMKKTKCKNLVFSSTAAIYQGSKSTFFKEDNKIFYNLLNPYAMSKYLSEKFLKKVCLINNNLNVVCLRYFNVAGAHESGKLGEDPKTNFNNLFPSIIKSVRSKNHTFEIFGKNYKSKDGTAVRDYVHVNDIARAHVDSLNFLKKKKGFHLFNLGTNKGTSVLKVIDNFEKIIGIKIKYVFKKKRIGDSEKSVAYINKAKKILKWRPLHNINDICNSIYRYSINNKDN